MSEENKPGVASPAATDSYGSSFSAKPCGTVHNASLDEKTAAPMSHS